MDYQTPQGKLVARLLEYVDSGGASQARDFRKAVSLGEMFIYGDGSKGSVLPSFDEVFRYFIGNFQRAVIQHGEKVIWVHLPPIHSRDDPFHLGEAGYIGFQVKK